jgi:hypothetical protein
MNTSAMELRLSWWMRQMTFISGQEHFGHFNIQDHLVEKQTDNLAAYENSLKVKFLRNKWNAIMENRSGK